MDDKKDAKIGSKREQMERRRKKNPPMCKNDNLCIT